MILRRLAAAALCLLSAACHDARDEYDLVIRGGTIIDGSGAPRREGDVAIRGDRIAAVGRFPGRGREEIDARGLVVAPGFIDMHSHSDYLLLEDGAGQSKIRQGVTTEVLGEESSGGPSKGKLKPRRVQGDAEGNGEWSTLGGYFDALERSRISVNVASYVGQGNVWRCVMGDSFERPTPAQIGEMKALVAEAMEDGAFGLSTMLASGPGFLATTDDLVELCSEVKRHGGLYSSHIRNEGTLVFDAVQEAIAIGERAGVPVDIIHLKIAEQKNWGRMKDVVALIEAARARGVNVQANIYPYTRGNNNLVTILPPWAHEGGVEKLLARLRDPGERSKMKRDILEGVPGWYNHYTAVGGDWSRMLVNGNLSAPNRALEGQTMDRILAKRGAADPVDGLFDFLLEEHGSIPTIYAHHTEEDMNLALSRPWCSIGSDGLAHATEGPLRRGRPHPRSFGTFPRVLGLYARERKLLTLEDAVRKMTSLSALKIGLRDRGTLRAGAFADVVLFDAARVIDKADYLDPFRYPEGIDVVIVNGEVTIDHGRHTGARAGRALRHGKLPASPAAAEAGWTALFDGRTLGGWEPKNGTASYTAADGCIVGKTSEGSPNSFLATTKSYGDFELKFEVKVDDALNSGVQIRSASLPEYRNGVVHGPQVEISIDGMAGFIFGESTKFGWLSEDRTDPAAHAAFRKGEWNRYRVLADGKSIRTWVNDVPVANLVDEKTGMMSGFIGLQVHGIKKGTGPCEVRWRNLFLRDLK